MVKRDDKEWTADNYVMVSDEQIQDDGGNDMDNAALLLKVEELERRVAALEGEQQDGEQQLSEAEESSVDYLLGGN